MEKPSLNKAGEVLMIFVKNPEPGKVKTRLASEMGAEEATRVYEALLEITRKATEPLLCAKKVYYQDNIPSNDLWSLPGYKKVLQEGGDLGKKMANAFRDNLCHSQKVIVIGSDCAEISTPLLQKAFDKLNHHDAVIGPAEDGGYYLLGMKTFEPELFRNKSWSTETVLKETLQTLDAKKLTYAVLPCLNDIDDLSDLQDSALKGHFNTSYGHEHRYSG